MDALQVTALQNVRAGAKTSGLAKKVFSQGADAMTTAELTQNIRGLLLASGIQVPQTALIGLDGAQMILAGGVFVDDIAAGATIFQAANPLALTISGTVSLLADVGLLDPQFADFASLGVNAVMAIASGGANILADIGAVIALINVTKDLGHDFFGNSDAAKAGAMSALHSAVHNIMSPEVSNAVNQIADFNRGTQNPFDMIGAIALDSPDLFANFFPDLAVMFPTWMTVTVTATTTSIGWFSDKSDTEISTFKRLITNKEQVESVLINKYLAAPMQDYFRDAMPSRNISLKSLSILSMILSSTPGGDVLMDLNFDIIAAMRSLGITPAILGDDWLFKGGFSHTKNFGADFDPDSELPYTPLTLRPANVVVGSSSGVVINGLETESAEQKADRDYAKNLKEFQYNMMLSDQLGDIDTLCNNPEGLALLKEWAKITVIPTWNANSLEPQGFYLKPQSVPISKQPWFDLRTAVELLPLYKESLITHPNSPYDLESDQYYKYVKQNYSIDVSDYWKCLSVLKVMEKANLFQDKENILSLYGDPDGIQDGFKKVYTFILAKNMNLIARNNVADYLGIEFNSLRSRQSSQGTLYFYEKRA